MNIARNLNSMKEEKKSYNYEIKETFTMSGNRINLYALLFLFPLLLLFTLPYVLIWGFPAFKSGFSLFTGWKVLPLLLGGIILHEGLHGMTLVLLTGGKNRVVFGFNRELLAPYAHFKGPVRAWQYILVAAMPGIIMGLVPLIISLMVGNAFYHLFGILFTWTAAGDLISILAVSRYPSRTLIQDHPDTLGFHVVEEKSHQA